MKEALWLSTATGLSVFLGVGAVLLCRRVSIRLVAGSLSLSATVMLLVALVDLLPTAVGVGGTFAHMGLGMGAALLTMIGIHRVLDHGAESGNGLGQGVPYGRLGWYLAAAIVAHNVPEGAAIGVGYGTERELGLTLALAMAIHNIPEGVGLAAPLLAAGRSPSVILGISLLAGGALPLGTWIGIGFLLDSPDAVAAGLFFATTTMIWVVVMEVMPQAWRSHRLAAAYGLILGGILTWGLHAFHG